MFAAVISMNILSKEEAGHTSEFLFSLPVSRGKVVWMKWGAVCTGLLLFHAVCAGFYGMGFLALSEGIPGKEWFLYHVMQLLMGLELAGICFAASALSTALPVLACTAADASALSAMSSVPLIK